MASHKVVMNSESNQLVSESDGSRPSRQQDLSDDSLEYSSSGWKAERDTSGLDLLAGQDSI